MNKINFDRIFVERSYDNFYGKIVLRFHGLCYTVDKRIEFKVLLLLVTIKNIMHSGCKGTCCPSSKDKNIKNICYVCNHNGGKVKNE